MNREPVKSPRERGNAWTMGSPLPGTSFLAPDVFNIFICDLEESGGLQFKCICR